MERMAERWRAMVAAVGLAALGLWLPDPAAATAASGPELLHERCSACHDADPAGGLARISHERKTPEGWRLTLSRMERWHGVALTAGEEQALVKWLADHQGLAPEEAAPFRYALERRPVSEAADDADLAAMCAGCHTYARFGLQRRDQAEWTKLVHMHAGQWPSIEYIATSRGRQWWKEASTELPAKLAAKFPLDSEAWRSWSARRPADLSGIWSVAGHRPGKGDYRGQLEVRRQGADTYALAYRLRYADGSRAHGEGRAVVYTGYEWRAQVTYGKERQDEVFAVSADGRRLAGRWFLDGQDAVGGDVVAVRGGSAIAAVQPPYLKAGAKERITIVGSGLAGPVDLGPGVAVGRVIAATPGAITVEARAAADAALGPRAVAVGQAKSADALVVYDRVAAVRVEPPMAIARMGGNGGPIAAAPAQFDAIGYMTAPGGPEAGQAKGGIRIGAMAARWTVAPFDEAAAKDEDVRFGGRMRTDGLFLPGAAGPNPHRGGMNNAANLAVKAEVDDGGRPVEGTAHLVVAPQRWNDAPIR